MTRWLHNHEQREHTHTHTHTVDCLFRTHLTKRNHSFCPSDQILALDFHACWRVVDPNLFPSLPIPLSNWYCRLYAQSLVFHYVIIFLLQLLGNGGGEGKQQKNGKKREDKDQETLAG